MARWTINVTQFILGHAHHTHPSFIFRLKYEARFLSKYRFAIPPPQRYGRRSAHAGWLPTSLVYALTLLQSDSSLYTLFTESLRCLQQS
jgi:hypothetical protein